MKVFISSTYKDLIDYRAAAIEAVEGTSYQAVKMEVFGARSDEPLKACLQEIEQSDLFVGIYAHRYGYVPDDSDISITEMEYLHAKKLSKPIYCFVIDDENQPWLPKWIDDEPGKSKLKDFKSRVQTDHIVSFFTTPDDLGMKVANALSHYVANCHPIPDSPTRIYESHKPIGSTLPTQPYFFGREKELKIIEEALSPESRTWGALIDGPGGIGKTALAIHAAYLASETLFTRKIFITAKVRELTPDGEMKLDDFTRPDYLSILNELALELGEEGIQRLEPGERANVLRLALSGKKALIIFDNLETLSEDQRTRLFQFLSRLPEGNKAIVTSRRRADVDARVIRLDRISAEDALQLIEELAKNNPRLAREDEYARRNLYEITNGNPLLIKWVCGQLGREGSVMHTITEACEFIENAPKGNDPLEYIFGDLLETLTENEIKALAALTYFTQPAQLKWITKITDLTEQVAKTALEDLTDRSILISNIEGSEFFLPPLAAQFVRYGQPKIVDQTGYRLSEYAYTLVTQNGGRDNWEGYKILDAEWPAIVAALPSLLLGHNTKLQDFCNATVHFLMYRGFLDEWLWLSKKAEEKALAAGDMTNVGLRVLSAGYVYQYRGQFVEVLDHATRALNLLQNSEVRIQASRLLAGYYKFEKNFSKAIEITQSELDSFRVKDAKAWEVALLLTDLGWIFLEVGNLDIAKQYFNEGIKIAVDINDIENILTGKGGLAEIALENRKWKLAEEIALDALKTAEKIGKQVSVATNATRYAKALAHQGHAVEGSAQARRAIEIFKRLHMDDGVKEAVAVLKECEIMNQTEN